MENQVENKFTWVIEDYKDLQYMQPTIAYSNPFSIGGCKWLLSYRQLNVYPEGHINEVECLSFSLEAYEPESLPCGWKICAKFSFTVVNQISEQLSKQKKLETKMWFDEQSTSRRFVEMLPLTKLHEDDCGLLEKEELKIIVQIDVLQVIGGLNESKAASQRLEEGFECYGLLHCPSQVDSVKRLFKSHPDISSEVHTKSKHLRITYINVLLGLIQTMCLSPEELTDDDLKEASAALSYVVSAGFKVDWLEMNLHEVLKKKKTLQNGQSRLPEMEEEMLKLNKKTQDHKALLGKERKEVAAAKIPLSFDDFL